MQTIRAEMFWRMKVFHVFVLLAVLQFTKPASAQNTTVSPTTTVSSNTTILSTTPSAPNPGSSESYLTLPKDFKAAVGDPAGFMCGVPETSEGLTFTFYGSTHNYTLSCPSGHVEDIPQALEGYCLVANGELLAIWTLKGTSFPDDGSRVVCQRRGHPAAPAAHLSVYDNGSGNSLLIGLGIGGCFGVLLVFGLLYLMLMKSETLQACFRGSDNRGSEDLTEIVDNIEPTSVSKKMRDL